MPTYYVFDENKNKVEVDISDGIQKVVLDEITDAYDDTSFHQIAFVTQSKYNELEQRGELIESCLYHIIDDSTIDDIQDSVDALNTRVGSVENRASSLESRVGTLEGLVKREQISTGYLTEAYLKKCILMYYTSSSTVSGGSLYTDYQVFWDIQRYRYPSSSSNYDVINLYYFDESGNRKSLAVGSPLVTCITLNI